MAGGRRRVKRVGRRHGGCPATRQPSLHTKGRTVIDHQANQDIRTLFDWRNAAGACGTPRSGPESAPVGNSDLELALQLLACNPRDREQFMGGRSASSST
jgi:hypothetical protein